MPIDKKQLEKGTAHENAEHPGMDGGLIARQHLGEIPDYYDRLEEMESEAKDGMDEGESGEEPDRQEIIGKAIGKAAKKTAKGE